MHHQCLKSTRTCGPILSRATSAAVYADYVCNSTSTIFAMGAKAFHFEKESRSVSTLPPLQLSMAHDACRSNRGALFARVNIFESWPGVDHACLQYLAVQSLFLGMLQQCLELHTAAARPRPSQAGSKLLLVGFSIVQLHTWESASCDGRLALLGRQVRM